MLSHYKNFSFGNPPTLFCYFCIQWCYYYLISLLVKLRVWHQEVTLWTECIDTTKPPIHFLFIQSSPQTLIDTMVYQKIINDRKERALYLLFEQGWEIERIVDALGNGKRTTQSIVA